MKKLLWAMALALILTLGLLPVIAFGSGAATEIATPEQLAAMPKTAGSYVLTADIELPSDWTPLGDSYKAVHLDGGGYTVTLSGQPLFDSINDESSVCNLILQGSVTSTDQVGSLTRSLGGTVRNCVSYADVTYTGESGGWSPKFVAGLIGYANSGSAGLQNCVYAGELSQGSSDCYGAFGNVQMGSSINIENCIGIGSKAGMSEGFPDNTDIAAGSNTLVADTAAFNASLDAYVTQLNANRQDGDLEWEVKESKLALKRAAVEAATEEQKQALSTAIAAAGEVDTTKLYTADTWADFAAALETARAQAGIENPASASVVNATNSLTAATAALEERPLTAVDFTGQEVTSITTVSGLENLTDGQYYRLDADLTITDNDFWFNYMSTTMNSVLDGNGHTITLANGKPLWSTIGADGVVQNLGVKGAAQNSTSDIGALAKDCQGLIINCWSQAAVTSAGANGNIKNTGGLVANLQSGGAIVNSYVSGQVTAKGSQGSGQVGALAGTAEANTMVKNGYWLEGIAAAAVGGADGQVVASAAKTRPEFYGDDFLALLNAGRDANGKEWTLSDEGWPHLGAAGTFQPPSAISLTFTAHDGAAYNFTDAEGLTLPLSAVMVELGQSAGQLSYPVYNGEVAWVPDYDGSNKNVMVNEDGSVTVTGAGSTKVTAYAKSSWSGTQYETKLAGFNITVTEITADGLRLSVSGDHLTADTPYAAYTVAGSATVNLQPEILVNGEWKTAPVSYFTLTDTGKIYRINGAFSATEPGVMTITATGLGQTAAVQVTSTYVPISGVNVSPNGEYTIHGRNANSTGLGDFLDLTLSHSAGTVTVEPANASYPNAWTLTSSDNDVAEYVSSMLLAVLPKKAGTVTLTAAANDPGLTQQPTGASVVTLKYFNPVTEVTLANGQTAFSVAENQSIDLPLQFTGPQSAEGYHVTEPGMVWTFSGDGEVEISRKGNLGVLLRTEKEYCVANDQYQLTGIAAGTVTVTGTPLDTTGGAQPITFTVTVEGGAQEEPVDSPALAAAALVKAQTALQTTNAGHAYAYGDEWDVFALTRSGVTVDAAGYLQSVKETYQNPGAGELKPTTLARVVLALGVLDRDASDFEGLNFIEMLCQSDAITTGGNEPMWALIALDSLDYAVPADARWTRDKLVTELIEQYQNPETGGFGLNDNVTSGIDMTAMAVQALAPYVDARPDAAQAVDKALGYLKDKLDRNCRYDSAEAVAQVIVALAALDKDPAAAANGFVQSPARNLITGLLGYQQEDGAFRHFYTDESSTKMSTLQALYALEAYERQLNGANALYDLTDINPRTTLAARIKEANALQETDYTADTWSALQAVLTAAQGVYDKSDADTAAMQQAAADLSAAILALEPVKPSGGGSKPQPGDKTITVSFRLIGDSKHDTAAEHSKYINWIKTYNVAIPVGGTVYDAFAIALAENGMDFEEDQYSYISSIQAPVALGGYWLGELDNGGNSGWKYLVNGKYPNVGLRYYWLKDGDKIIWRYVDDYQDAVDNTTKWQEAVDTAPSGSGNSSGGGSGAAVTAAEKPGITTEMKPEVTANAKGEAIAKPEDKTVTETINQAKKDNANTIVIEPEVKGDATKVGVELPKTALENMTKETDADLTVKTDLGSVTVPAKGLEQLTKEKGNNVTVTVEAKGGVTNIEVAVGGKAVEKVNGGIGVTVPAEKANTGNVLAIVKADGTQEIVKKSVVEGKNVQAVVDGSCTVKVIENGKQFADTTNHWGKDAVAFVTARELFNGTSDKAFEPNADMSRAMLATVLWRLEDEQTAAAAKTFSDIANGQYYTEAVAWASDKEIVTGYEDGSFAPDKNINREELAVMLYRYAKAVGLDTKAAGDLTKFTDGGKVSAFASDAMKWAVDAGLMNGKENNTLDPQGNATRAEVATTMQRLVGLLVK